MIWALAATAGFIIWFHLVGFGWSRVLLRERPGSLVAGQVVGASLSLFTAAIAYELQCGALMFGITSAIIAALGWILYFLKRASLSHSSKSSTRSRFWSGIAVVFVSVLAYTVLSQPFWFSPGMTYRVGPDIFGWSSAALEFCRGGSLSELSARVQDQLGSTPLANAFSPALVRPNATHIYQIPSFSDQGAAEFLLGARRIGLPGLLGSACSVTGSWFMPALVTGIAAWAIGLISAISFGFAQRTTGKVAISIALGLIGSLGFTLLNVSLEGGLGQTVVMPFFVGALYLVASRNPDHRALAISLVALIAAACATYVDALLVAAPVLLVILVLNFTSRRWAMRSFITRGSLYTLVAMLLALSPMLVGGVSYLVQWATNTASSGWNDGYLPWPSNIYGIDYWLSATGWTQPGAPTAWLIASSAVTTLLLVVLVVYGGLSNSIPFVVTLALYLYLLVSVYIQGDGTNDYRLWKYGAFAQFVVVIVLANACAKRSRAAAAGASGMAAKYVPVLTWILIATTAISCVIFDIEWVANRTNSLRPDGVAMIRSVVDKYDLVTGTTIATQFTELALYGDLHYGSPSRSGDLHHGQRSTPARPVTVLEARPSTCSEQCLAERAGVPWDKVSSVTRIAQTQNYQLFLVAEK